MVRIEQVQLAECVNAGIITGDQAARLWAFLAAHGERADAAASKGPRFTFTNVLYYLGGMLAIGALSLFMTLGFERFGGSAILFIALAYMAVAWALATETACATSAANGARGATSSIGSSRAMPRCAR